MLNRDEYADLHTIEWDLLHSGCRDCYLNNLDCNRPYGECRFEQSKRR